MIPVNIFRIAALFTLLLSVPMVAWAQTSVAVVDVKMLLSDSLAAQSIQKQVQEQRTQFLEELSKQEQTLRGMEKSLLEASKSLSSEQVAEKKGEFEKQFSETRQLVQKRKSELDQAVGKAMDQLRDQLFVVVQKIATDKGYDLVISRQNVVVGAKTIDITDESMKALNESISAINLQVNSQPETQPQ